MKHSKSDQKSITVVKIYYISRKVINFTQNFIKITKIIARFCTLQQKSRLFKTLDT